MRAERTFYLLCAAYGFMPLLFRLVAWSAVLVVCIIMLFGALGALPQ